MKNLLAGASLFALLASAGSLYAAEAAAAPDAPTPAPANAANEVEELIVTGTRETGVKAADSAAPIQLVGKQQLLRTGATDLATSLTAAVPSLNIQTNGGDAEAVHILAALRGLSPDDTLVLVDGKRRHPTSNLAVDTGSAYSGSATTDLNYIPVGAIDHIEVLTDGAAAQYGTDAIAGVVNIILKKNASGGSFTATGGEYYSGQGATGAVSYNQGFNLMDKGFLNITLEERYHDFSTLGIGDARNTDSNGVPLALSSYSDPINVNANNATNNPHLNRVYGDPEYNIYNAFYNSAYALTDKVELYSFGNFSYNASQHFENYREPDRISGCSSTFVPVAPYTSCVPGASGGVYGESYNEVAFPDGFDPKEKFDERDFSVTAGLRGEILGWHWDLSTVYGGNHTEVYVLDTGNVSLYQTLQAASATQINYPLHTIYDGNFDATEWTNTLDVDKSFNVGLAAPLNVAFGFEERRDTFGIGSGEPESFYGTGSQSFAGYAPTDAGSYSRVNYAAYFDIATSPIKNLKVDLAGRYEHYSDFGSTKDGKVTVRYDFNPMFAVRGTISDGFRAPTLAEEYYSGVNVGPTSVGGQLPPNSAAAKAAGFSPLQPETSINYSVGFIAHPMDRMQITLDAYQIILHSRIINAGPFTGSAAECNPPGYNPATVPANVSYLSCPAGYTPAVDVISQSVLNAVNGRGITTAGLTSVSISSFVNGMNTTTNGIEATFSYASDFEEFGHVDWNIGFNYNKTQITKIDPIPSFANVVIPQLGFNQTQLLSIASASQYTTALPRDKVILQAYWTKGRFSVNLRETIYGKNAELVYAPTLSGYFNEVVPTTPITDLDIGYKVTSHLKMDVGANNLFNQIPPLTPLASTGQPIDGGIVFHLPYGTAPWGQNGGYYYGRVTYTF
jgi:iron complex outermembrane receptor protein